MLRSKARPLFFVAVLLLASPVSAQRDRDAYNPNNLSSEITGQVNLVDFGAEAPNVPVRLERFSGGVVDQINTDGRGRFRFANLARGYYRVIISAPGLKPMQQDADLQVVAKTYLVFELVGDHSKAAAGLALSNDV